MKSKTQTRKSTKSTKPATAATDRKPVPGGREFHALFRISRIVQGCTAATRQLAATGHDTRDALAYHMAEIQTTLARYFEARGSAALHPATPAPEAPKA